MKGKDQIALSPADTVEQALAFTAKQLQAECDDYSEEQIRAIVPHLKMATDTHWRAKLRALIRGLEKRSQLEAMGSQLTEVQFLELLELCAGRPTPQRDKLQAILVQLTATSFTAALKEGNQLQIQVLKDIAGAESLQHHLTLLHHDLSRQAESFAEDMIVLDQQIESYDVRGVRQHEVDEFLQRLKTTATFFNEGLDLISLALGIIWNSEREDLIERYTVMKENWLRYLHHAIGRPATRYRQATALYANLEARLNGIFGDPNIPHLSENVLDDEDPALEALTALGIWYVQDYWELGLLPEIKSREALKLDASLHNDRERALHNARLTIAAREKLEMIGLESVIDLKHAHIYSRNMLARYIDAHKDKMEIDD